MSPFLVWRRSALVVVTLVACVHAANVRAQSSHPAEPLPGSPSPTETAASPEQKSPYSASYTLTFASRYLFQGLDYSEGKAVLEPEIDISAGPFTAKVWANHDLTQGVSNEFDISLEHGWTMGKLSGSLGYTHLHYPHRVGWDPSQEAYVSFAREGPVNTSLAVHYDFDAGTGTYSTLGLNRAVERPFGTLSLGANLFYQSGYYDASGFPAAELNLNLSRTVGKLSFTPSVSRFVTWENGDFRGPAAVASAWLFSLSFAQEF